MNPKDYKDIIPALASQFGLPEDTVKTVLDYYWAKVKSTINSLDHNEIYIDKIGSFKLKYWKFGEFRAKLLEDLRRYKYGKWDATTANIVNDYTRRLDKLNERIGEYNERKLKALNKKAERFVSITRNMEEQGSDSGGDQEQPDKE